MPSKSEAHAYCTLCHHYFHNNPKFLPKGDEKLIVIATSKRTRDQQPVYGLMIDNTYFHVWHMNRREEVWGGDPQWMCAAGE